jgi:hypothetical protein
VQHRHSDVHRGLHAQVHTPSRTLGTQRRDLCKQQRYAGA